MKIKVTKKSVREGGVILHVGYCDMQYLLRGRDPWGYSDRAEGWACDYYDVFGVTISTGYAPIGRAVDYALTQTYEAKARDIWRDYNLSYEQRQAQVNELLHEFLREVA